MISTELAVAQKIEHTSGTLRIAPRTLMGSDRRRGLMAFVIAEPCIGTKDTACVDACPVDCIHPKKEHDVRRRSCWLRSDSAALHRSRRVHRLWGVRAGLPGLRDFCAG
jgi:NAD-dependent dihydropyrimidine dehydrogenase PreA subunit